MTSLLLILLVVGVALTVLLWAGTVYLQSFIYTEASTDVFWQAPAAAGVLTLFFLLWCVLDVNAEGARPDDLPYDTIFRFSAEETKGKKPVDYLWAERKNEKEPVKYRRYTVGQDKYQYFEELASGTKGRPWSGGTVTAILIEEDGKKVRFVPTATERGAYRRFVDPESGWEMPEYDDGPTGQPMISRTGRFLVNVALNVLHFGVWVVCVWLLLRFQPSHAVPLALALWLVTTLTVLPMLLMRSGEVAAESAVPQQTSLLIPARAVGQPSYLFV